MKKVIIVYWQKMIVRTCLLAILITIIFFGYNIVFKIPIKVSLNEVFQPKTYFEPGESPEGSIEEDYVYKEPCHLNIMLTGICK